MSAKLSLSRRDFLKASAITAAGGVLAACAPAGTTATNTPQPAAPTAVEVINLTILRPDREIENKVDQANIEAFNKKMEAEGKPWRVNLQLGAATDNDYRAKMTVDAAAGNLADIAGVSGTDVADYVAAGYLLDLKPYFDKWPDYAQFYDVLKPLVEYDGKIVGPPQGTTFTFFIRKDVLDGASISSDQPKTWDDFYAACDAIKTKANIIPCGLPAGTPWGGGSFGEGFRMVWLSFNGTIIDPADGKWVVSSPNLLKAMQVYETLAKNEYLDVEGLLTPNPWEPIKYQKFPQGKLAIVTGGDWQWTFDWGPIGATPIEGLFEKVARWQFPQEDGQAFTYVEGSPSACVSAKTKAPDGCAAYLEFINSTDRQCTTMDLHIGGPSGRKDLADACPKYKTVVGGKFYESSQLFETGRTYQFNHVGAEKIADGIAKATEDIITLKKSAQEAMDDFSEKMLQQLGADLAKTA